MTCKHDPTKGETCREAITANVALVKRRDKLQAVLAYTQVILNFQHNAIDYQTGSVGIRYKP